MLATFVMLGAEAPQYEAMLRLTQAQLFGEQLVAQGICAPTSSSAVDGPLRGWALRLLGEGLAVERVRFEVSGPRGSGKTMALACLADVLYRRVTASTDADNWLPFPLNLANYVLYMDDAAQFWAVVVTVALACVRFARFELTPFFVWLREWFLSIPTIGTLAKLPRGMGDLARVDVDALECLGRDCHAAFRRGATPADAFGLACAFPGRVARALRMKGAIYVIDHADCASPAVAAAMSAALRGSPFLLSSQSDALFGDLRTKNHKEASEEIGRRMELVSDAFASPGQPQTLEEGTAKFRQTARVSLENQTLLDHINLSQRLFAAMKESRYLSAMMNIEAEILATESYRSKDLIAEMFEYGASLPDVLRLLCLDSLVKGGTSDFASHLTSLVFNYGFHMVIYALRLQELGLLRPPHGSEKKWRSVLKKMRAYSPNWEAENDQAAASYLGYAPLSVRFVERIADGDIASVQSAMKELGEDCRLSDELDRSKGSFLIVFIGGCTHAELNSLRRIGQARRQTFQVITTDLFSSSEFFNRIAKGIPGYSATMA